VRDIEGGALSAKFNHRGSYPEAFVASQGSQGLLLDYGLCALINATSDNYISSSDAQVIARAMEAILTEDERE
jgi:hypothetical protein